MQTKPNILIEPFAGGAIVGLTVAFEQLADLIILVEYDDAVASVWQTLINSNYGQGQWLAEQMNSFVLTEASLQDALSRVETTLENVALQTILHNRTSHGGRLSPGSGRLKRGESDKGLGSRWYPETLRRRMLDIVLIKERLEFIHGNGLDVLNTYSAHNNAVFFIDPPYSVAGKRAGARLYRHNELDHGKLFEVVSNLSGDFLMTYDNIEEVVALANQYNLDTELVAMRSTHHNQLTELLIGRDLGWLRQGEAPTLFTL